MMATSLVFRKKCIKREMCNKYLNSRVDMHFIYCFKYINHTLFISNSVHQFN